MDGWMNGWMDGWIDGRTDGWKDGRTDRHRKYVNSVYFALFDVLYCAIVPQLTGQKPGI